MADADEDLIARPGATGGDADSSDEETEAFKFLTSISKDSTKFPKRGEKDFEPDSTALQSDVLTASRQALHEALSHQRLHQPKNHRFATYYPPLHKAYIERPAGSAFWQRVGHTLSAQDDPFHDSSTRANRLWLLPEEVVYLLERGTLDVRWPPDPDDDDDTGLPMSLQGAYATFIGDGSSERNALTLERYIVYANLMRTGFTVMRAPSFYGPGPPSGDSCYPPAPARRTWQLGLANSFQYLNSLLSAGSEDAKQHEKTGPLVHPGLYRDYATIYRKLALIDFHDPENHIRSSQVSPPETDPNLRVTFHIWKSSTTNFKKTAPGEPDFRIAVVDAKEMPLPSPDQLSALMDTLPYCPPDPKHNMYRKLKDGYKNVILAVVDEGLISFLRIADSAFGREKLYEREARPSGPKRGGGVGRGRGGRGRGRGRGRGG